MKAHHRLEALAENIGQQKFSQGLVSSFLVYILLELRNKQRHVGMTFPKCSQVAGWLAKEPTSYMMQMPELGNSHSMLAFVTMATSVFPEILL
jgi:hypothetical protein